MDLYFYWPAVSQNQYLIDLLLQLCVFYKNTAPKVDQIVQLNQPNTNLNTMLLFPTPTQPITTTFATLIIFQLLQSYKLIIVNINRTIHKFVYSIMNRRELNQNRASGMNLNTTTQQFYTKRKITTGNVNFLSELPPKFSKIVRILNQSRSFVPLSLQNRNRFEKINHSIQQDQTILKINLLNNIINSQLKKLPLLWKDLYNSHQKVMSSNSLVIIQKNNINFLQSFIDLMENYSSKNIQSIKKQPNTDQYLKFENMRLQKQNLMMKEWLSCISSEEKGYVSSGVLTQGNGKQSKYLIEQQEQFEDLKMRMETLKRLSTNKKIAETKNIKSTYNSQIQKLQEIIARLKQDKNTLQQKVQELKSNNENLCSEIVDLKYIQNNSSTSINQWKEHLAMQAEQILSFNIQAKILRKNYYELNRKYLLIIKKINKIGKEKIDKAPEISQTYLNIFNQQVQAFSKIRNLGSIIFRPNFAKQKQKNSINKTMYQKFMTDKNTLHNLDGAKKASKNHGSYLKPTFYCLIQESLNVRGIDSSNFQHMNVESISFDIVIPTIRAIFDSKFNQIIYKKLKNVTNFSNFTYSWLNNFYIDRSKRKIMVKKTDLNPDIVADFYIRLMNKTFNSNWQVVTFRQFLLDTLTTDQLYFYLICRFYLFKGDILNNIDAQFSTIFQVSYNCVLPFLIEFVDNVDYRKSLQDYLKKFIKHTKKASLIDSNFLLRLVLEYYRHKRRAKIDQINQNIQGLLKGNKTMGFESFARIFENNSIRISLQQKLQAYTKCYCLGNGNITSEIIQTVFAQQKILCYLVKRVYKNEKVFKINNVNDKNEDYTISPAHDYLYREEQVYKKYKDEYLVNLLNKIGLECVKFEYQKNEELNDLNLHDRYQFSLNISTFLAKKLFFSGQVSTQKMGNFITAASNSVAELNKQSGQKILIKEFTDWFKRVTAGKLIMRFYRRKKQKMLENFHHVKVKDQENDKATIIRTQFNNLIDSVKKKYKNDQISEV